MKVAVDTAALFLNTPDDRQVLVAKLGALLATDSQNQYVLLNTYGDEPAMDFFSGTPLPKGLEEWKLCGARERAALERLGSRGQHIIARATAGFLCHKGCDALFIPEATVPSGLAETAAGAGLCLFAIDVFNIPEAELARQVSERFRLCGESDTSPAANEHGTGHIAMFTPLPPQKTGIANYSWDILQSMAKLCKVDVFTEDGVIPDIPAIPNCTFFPASAYGGLHAGYDATIYQIGNSPFHTYMLPYLRQYGGVVELHEANLHAWLFHEFVNKRNDWDTYREALYMDVPRPVADRFIKKLQTGTAFDADVLVVHSFVTRYAHNVIVHNQYTKRILLEKDIGCRVAVVPHYAKAQQPFGQAEARTALGIPDGLVFASFGAVAQNRRLESVLYAMERLTGEGTPAQLYITGADDWGTQYALKALVRRLGLQECVRFTGRLDDKSFWQYLAACDVVLSLRWPYRGESSGIMCQALASGKPLLVTDVGCFGELPDEVCLKIPPPTLYGDAKQEAHIVADAMYLLATDSRKRQAMGDAAAAFAAKELPIDYLACKILHIAVVPTTTALDEAVLKEIAAILCQPGEQETSIPAMARLLAYCLRV